MKANIQTLANLHRATRADGLAIRACNADIAADVVAAQLACTAKKQHKDVTEAVYGALRTEFNIPAKSTIADLRQLASAAKDADKVNADSVKSNKVGKTLAKRSENALVFMRAYNALAQAISRARRDAGLVVAKAATEDAEADKDVRGMDAADVTAESVAAGLAKLPAGLLAEAVAMLPAAHKSAVALALDC